MKKRIAICLSLIMLFSFAACGQQRSASEEPAVSDTVSQNAQSMPEHESSEESKDLEEASASSEQENAPQEETAMQPTEQTPTSSEEAGGKILIAYFSLIDIVPEGADASANATPSIGSTESAALEIQKQVGGDLFAIKTVQTYPVSHREASAIAEEEMRSDARPELSTHVENMDEYDTVYIGYPIWWYIEPMAIRTFLEEYDFSGKTVIPFCTSMGAGVEESVENIASFAGGATVLDGVTLSTGRQDLSEEIAQWLADIEMK